MTNNLGIQSGIIISKSSGGFFKPFELAAKFQNEDFTRYQLTFTRFERTGDNVIMISTDGRRMSVIDFPKLPDALEDIAYSLPQGASHRRIETQSNGLVFIPFENVEVSFPNWRKVFDETDYMEHAPIYIPSKKQGETYKGTCGGAFSDAYNQIIHFSTNVPFSFIEPFQGLNMKIHRDIDPEKRNKVIFTEKNNMYEGTFIMMGREFVKLSALPPEKIRYLQIEGAVINNGEIEVTRYITGFEAAA
jgi:hypothetical protein